MSVTSCLQLFHAAAAVLQEQWNGNEICNRTLELEETIHSVIHSLPLAYSGIMYRASLVFGGRKVG